MTLDVMEFIRRFLMHVMPRSFVRIRYYGFMANRHRAETLQRGRQLLGAQKTPETQNGNATAPIDAAPGENPVAGYCPQCRQGRPRRVRTRWPRRGAKGKLKEVSCRKALLELYRRGLIPLPVADGSRFKRSCAEPPTEFLIDVPKLSCSLEELGEIGIVAVSSRYSKASQIWNALMERFHYLGKGPLCGAQIRYLVESSRYGWVGAVAFSAAQWRLKPRDEYIGWTEAARRANLHRVVCNSRFLILPGVHVPNLASHVLSLWVSGVVDDWSERYGSAPVIAETFVVLDLQAEGGRAAAR